MDLTPKLSKDYQKVSNESKILKKEKTIKAITINKNIKYWYNLIVKK